MPDEFIIGARVRLKASGAQDWIDPKMRRRATAGTPATITNVFGAANPPHRRSYRIKFDVVARMGPMTEIVPAGELESLSNA